METTASTSDETSEVASTASASQDAPSASAAPIEAVTPAADVAQPVQAPRDIAESVLSPAAELVPDNVTTIVVTQYTRRDDHDLLPGHFGRIESGEHAGQIAVFDDVVSAGVDGYPDLVNVTLRESGQRVTVPYAALYPTPFGGR